jgi:hypothetical protein
MRIRGTCNGTQYRRAKYPQEQNIELIDNKIQIN